MERKKRCMPPPTDVSLDIITFEHNHDRPSNKKLPGRKLLLFCVRSIYLNLAHFPFLCFDAYAACRKTCSNAVRTIVPGDHIFCCKRFYKNMALSKLTFSLGRHIKQRLLSTTNLRHSVSHFRTFL